MLYRDILAVSSQRKNVSHIDQWIRDCASSYFTKVIGFNFFLTLQYEIFPNSIIINLMKKFDDHLEGKATIDPLDRPKGFFYQIPDYISKLGKVNKRSTRNISTIISLYRVLNLLSINKGLNYHKANNAINDEIIVNSLLKKFIHLLHSSEFSYPFSGSFGITWFTHTQCIDNIIRKKRLNCSDATRVRNVLALPIENDYLLHVTYHLKRNDIIFTPTLFHSDFNWMFRTHYNKDGWGLTLNIESFQHGCKEGILYDMKWAEKELSNLGFADNFINVNEETLKAYLVKLINEYKIWASEKSNEKLLIDDLNFFLNRW